MKERILIGEEQQIRFRLNGSQNAVRGSQRQTLLETNIGKVKVDQ